MDWTTLIAILAPLVIGILSLALRFAIRQALDAKQAVANIALDLANFKTEVAKDYATGRALDKVQERIMGMLDQINEKIDRLVDSRLEGR